MTTYTEEDLVAALKKHDGEAYRYLYLHYRKALFVAVTQIIPDAETAGDILQEVFTLIWKGIDKYDPGKSRLFTWMLTLSRHAAINTTRSKSFKDAGKNEDLNDYVNTLDKKASAEININFIGLRSQVHQLKPEFKIVLELAYFNGYTQQEIADDLALPLGTVKTRLRNAIIELRKQFV